MTPPRLQAQSGQTDADFAHFGVRPDPAVARFAVPASREPTLSHARALALLRGRVRYVFVLYQENRSFDSYFGTFPGAEGLFSHSPTHTPGFYQPLLDTNGSTTSVHPFRLGPREYAADLDDVVHSHAALVAKMDIVNGVPRMDRFAQREQARFGAKGASTLRAKQFGELTMAYEDGDTIPLLWRYANRFVLCDHIFQQMTGPSTPGNLAIIGAQTGATQWMLHPEQAFHGNVGAGVPVLNDREPFWGSAADPTKAARMPVNPADVGGDAQINLTFSTLPLSLTGRALAGVAHSDRAPAIDLADVREDVGVVTASGRAAVPWGWYQEGYTREPTDRADRANQKGGDDDDEAKSAMDAVGPGGSHASYITHHDGPQYFGYIANNPQMRTHLHGLGDFGVALRKGTLPARGVFYVKGGLHNILGLQSADPNAKARTTFRGDDDHPGYSDAQISEAQIAETVNQIARSPYWKNCAIVITWDDSDGQYDHLPPPVRSVGPDGSVTTDGPRIPFLVISPYARVHGIVHDVGDHASVVKLVNAVFGLRPLADLPDERRGRNLGRGRGLTNQGPYDDLVPHITDLLGAFDSARLAGRAAALPADYALIPEPLVRHLPQQTGYGWHQVGIVPTDYRRGLVNEIPADFNPRPGTEPGLPGARQKPGTIPPPK